MPFIYFGTKEYMKWVKAPAINMNSSKAGWENNGSFLNGGAYSRRSTASHKTFSLSWDRASRDELRPILDYVDGVYGDGYIYISNPFAMDKNVLPSYVANSAQASKDGPILYGRTRPTMVNTAPVNDYPVQGATYAVNGVDTISGTPVPPPVYIPIPPGYTAWVGVHGTFTSSAVMRIHRYQSGVIVPAAATNATPLTTATLTRVVDSVGGDQYNGLGLSLQGIGNATLYGVMVQVLPNGVVPPTGGFISGQGQSGMKFTSQADLSEYSAVLDRVGVSVDLIEVESWEQQ